MRNLIAGLCVALAGCGGGTSPAVPAALVGLSVADAAKTLGAPDGTVTSVAPPTWAGGAPTPTLLRPGDSYQSLVYDDRGGQQLLLWAVPPKTYEAIMGTNPGPEPYYVVEVFAAEGGVRY